MPYESMSEVPDSLKGIEPKITLAQANVISAWADAMEKAEDGPESPWAVAISQFERLYESDGERWTKKAVVTQEAITCECLKCGYTETLPNGEHCAEAKCAKCGGEMRRLERPGRGQLQLVGNSITAKTHRETVGGIVYLVAPTVLLKQAVLNDEMVLADEIAAHFKAWNGRPVLVPHPEVNGVKVSANDPAILAHQQVGKLFNTTFDGGKLRGELWIDEVKAKGVSGGLEVLRRLQSNSPTEISTAYFRDSELTAGVWNGKHYESIARNLRPDHVAILLEAKGACNWQDGCGVPRVNEEGNVTVSNDDIPVAGATNDSGVLCALKTIFGALGVKFNQDEEVDEVKELVEKIVKDGRLALTEEQLAGVPEEALTAIVELLGKLPEAQESEPQVEGEDETEDDEEEDVETQESDDDTPPPQANVQDSAAYKTLMARVVALEARGKAESAGRKAELSAALQANESCVFTAEQLGDLSVATLEGLHRSLSPADYSGQGGGPVSDGSGLVEMTMPDIFAKQEGE